MPDGEVIKEGAMHSPLLHTLSPLKSPLKISPYRQPRRKKSISAMSINVSSMSHLEGGCQRAKSSRPTRVLRAPITLDSVTFSFSTDFNEVQEGTVGPWGAAFSIVNVFMGLCLLSYPYALARGGFISLIVLAFTCWAMSYTGKFIVRCFHEVPEHEQTYHGVGYKALDGTFALKGKPLKLGNVGKWLVTAGILLEFYGVLCIQFVFIWENISFLLPTVDLGYIAVVSSFAVLPTCWMLNVSELAFNSFLGCFCKVFTVLVIVSTFFMNTEVVETKDYDLLPQSAPVFSVSIGIYILSFAGHACLPEIYVSMKEPKQFEDVMDRCFVVMFFLYSGFALCGYLQFGSDTQVLITENLVNDGTASGAQLIIGKILVGSVIASCYFQIAPVLSVIASVGEDMYGIEAPSKKRLFRTCLLFGIAATGWCVQNKLAVLEAATGSLCTMITSVICPALFYYGLNLETVTYKEAVVLCSCMGGGVIVGIILLYNDIVVAATGQA